MVQILARKYVVFTDGSVNLYAMCSCKELPILLLSLDDRNLSKNHTVFSFVFLNMTIFFRAEFSQTIASVSKNLFLTSFFNLYYVVFYLENFVSNNPFLCI